MEHQKDHQLNKRDLQPNVLIKNLYNYIVLCTNLFQSTFMIQNGLSKGQPPLFPQNTKKLTANWTARSLLS